MITTTTETATPAKTETTPETAIAAVTGEVLDGISGGWYGPYAMARYAAHLERRAEWIEQRAERLAYRWGW